MRKILIATPLRGDLPPYYFNMLYRVLGMRTPELNFGYSFVAGTSVQWARDEAVQMARDKDCTDIIFWDKDLEPSVEHFIRLLSHEEELVCGLYSKREMETTWHMTGIKGEVPNEKGLLKVFQAAVGFSKISMSVFDKIRDANPEREYQIKNAGQPPVKLFEYFPMERFGPNTAQGKLKRLKELKNLLGNEYCEAVTEILDQDDYSTNAMLGEDYSFMRLAREAGVTPYLDTEVIIPHNGECQFPVPTQLLQKALTEEWREDKINT